MLAVIFALGALLGPQELSDAAASSGESSSIAQPINVSLADGAGQGTFLRSDQAFRAQVGATNVSATASQAGIRTGDISLQADRVGAGLQALNLSTGVATLGQSAISIAAGSVTLSATAK